MINHPDEAWTLFVKNHPEVNDELNRLAWRDTLPRFLAGDRYAALIKALGEDSIVPSLMMNGNPAYSLVMAQRIALGGEHPAFGVTDFWGNLAVAATWAIGFLVIGFTTFVANKHKHADIV